MRNFFTNFSFYLLSAVFNAIIGFISIIVFSHYISPISYGIFSSLMMFFVIFSIIIHGNIFILLTREFYADSFNKERFIVNIYIFMFFIYIFLFIVLLCLNDLILSFFNLNIEKFWIFFILFFSLIANYNQLNFNILRLEEKGLNYFIINIIFGFSKFFISFVILFFYRDWESLLEGAFIAEILILLYFFKNCSFKIIYFSIKYQKIFIRFVLKVFPTTLSWRIISFSDRMILLKFSTLEVVGIYSIALKLISIVDLLIVNFNKAFSPYLMKNMHINSKKNIKIVSIVYILFIMMIIITLYYVMPFVIKFFNSSYYSALEFFNLLLVVTLFRAFHILISNYLYFIKEEFIISKITTIVALLNIILDLFLFKYFGPNGVIIATAISYALIVVLEILFSIKKLKKR